MELKFIPTTAKKSPIKGYAWQSDPEHYPGFKTADEAREASENKENYGVIIPEGYVVIDIDDEQEAEGVHKVLNDYRRKLNQQLKAFNYAAMRTDRGIHFWFKDNSLKTGSTSHKATVLGVEVDPRKPGSLIIWEKAGKEREWLEFNDFNSLSEIPYFLTLDRSKKSYEFTTIEEGERHTALTDYFMHLQCGRVKDGVFKGYYDVELSDDDIYQLVTWVNTFFLKTPEEKLVEEVLDNYHCKSTDQIIEYLRSNSLAPEIPVNTTEVPEEVTESLAGFLNDAYLRKAEYNRDIAADEVAEYAGLVIGRRLDNGREEYYSSENGIYKLVPNPEEVLFNYVTSKGTGFPTLPGAEISTLVKIAKSRIRKIDILETLPDETDDEKYEDLSKKERRELRCWLHLKNCRFNPYTGETQTFSRDCMDITKIPVKYDEKAVKNDVVDKYFNDLFDGNEDLIKVVYQMIGYTLLRSQQMKTVFILLGGGNTGKTTFLEFLLYLAGKRNSCSISAENMMADKSRLVSLKNALINQCGEISPDRLNDNVINLLKAISGGDSIEVRGLYSKSEDIYSYTKMVYAMNNPFLVPQNAREFWNRVTVIPFNHVFKTDGEAVDDIFTEGAKSYVFNKAMAALREALKEKKWHDCEAVENAKKAFEACSRDIIDDWMEAVDLTPESIVEKELSVNDVLASYTGYIETLPKEVQKRFPFHRNKFWKQFQDKCGLVKYQARAKNGEKPWIFKFA